MKLTALKKWEVKTGKNRGIYVAVTPKQAEAFYPRWGGLVYETNYGIYQYHGVVSSNIVLTTPIWARHSMRKEWESVIISN